MIYCLHAVMDSICKALLATATSPLIHKGVLINKESDCEDAEKVQ